MLHSLLDISKYDQLSFFLEDLFSRLFNRNINSLQTVHYMLPFLFYLQLVVSVQFLLPQIGDYLNQNLHLHR